MTLEQALELQALAQELVGVAIEECDPSLWPGAGKRPNELTRQERGDRVWAKKNAAATMSLLLDISRVLGVERSAGAGTVPEDVATDEDIDAMIRAAESDVRRFQERRADADA